MRSKAFVAALALGLAVTACQSFTPAPPPWAPAPAPKAKPTIAKVCTNCHKAEPGSLRGNFENVAFKSESIQLKIDNDTVIVKFNPDDLKVVVGDQSLDSDGMREIKKGHEIRVAYTEKGGVKMASLVSSKPPIKLSADKLLTTPDVEKLIAQGPEKGKYVLIDARPAPRFMEGAIPTAINIPFVAFDKMIDKLPQDKNMLIVYYCGGVT